MKLSAKPDNVKRARALALARSPPVELPGIEPVSGRWSVCRTGTELRNDIHPDSPELSSLDTKCAQNVPIRSRHITNQRRCLAPRPALRPAVRTAIYGG